MKHRGEFAVKAMCRMLKVSRAGFYEWRGRRESPRAAENRELTAEIHELFERSDET